LAANRQDRDARIAEIAMTGAVRQARWRAKYTPHIAELGVENAKLRAENARLKAENDRLRAQNAQLSALIR
jgi:hypothetical protein